MDNVHPFQSSEEIRSEARGWVLKFDGDAAPSAADIAALREWAGRSPAHRLALEQSQEFWSEADLLSELAVPLGRFGRERESGYLAQLFTTFFSVNRAIPITATLFLGVVVGVYSWLLPTSGTVGNDIYSTVVGEQKTLVLMDQSKIQLDTNSQVRVDYDDGLRKIHLVRGKVHFEVSKNPDLPFEVYTDKVMVRAVGTAFSVFLTNNDTRIIVDEGRVDLVHVNSRSTQRVSIPIDSVAGSSTSPSKGAIHNERQYANEVFLSLEKGQSASMNHEKEVIKEALADKELLRELAWREGMLIFVGNPLSEVVSEVNRYTDVDIEISDQTLSDLEIGGRFKVGELEALFDALEAGFGVQVSHVDKDHIQLHASSP